MGSGEKVIGYVRVSTDEQGMNGVGLEAQRAAIEAECDRRGWRLVRIEHDVLSGRNLNRPGLQRALDACRTGKVAGVVVAKLDRLSRSLIDFAGLLEQARREEWNLVALDLGVDLSTPSGEFLASVMASAAQWERRIIGERTKEALAVKKAQGVKLGRPASIPPALARRIVRMRQRGMTLQAICDRLNREGIPTARGGRLWRPTSLRAVLAAQTSPIVRATWLPLVGRPTTNP
jgi:DNA invertase Pin-like site-specific DNA recombinase